MTDTEKLAILRIAVRTVSTKLHHAVNGGLKTPGKADRIGDCKRIMRECRDIADDADMRAKP